jgi:hypothetical protein
MMKGRATLSSARRERNNETKRHPNNVERKKSGAEIPRGLGVRRLRAAFTFAPCLPNAQSSIRHPTPLHPRNFPLPALTNN